MSDLPDEVDRQAMKEKLRTAIASLFDPDLVARFERAKDWDSGWFSRWARSIDFDQVTQRLACLTDRELPEAFRSRDLRSYARVVYESLALLVSMLEADHVGRELAGRIASAANDRDLCLIAIAEWRRCP